MIKHVLVAAAAAAAMAAPGAAHAQQRCPQSICLEVMDPCDVAAADICVVCILPESSPVVPCLFGP